MQEIVTISSEADQYAAAYTTEEDALLKEVAAYTISKHPKHHMLSGAVQGKLLEMVTRMVNAKNVLEIGSFTGYSALCMAKGITDDGCIHTIELREEDAATAAEFFKRSSFSEKIHLHIGEALEIIPKLNQPWDLVFIDADKVNYINYYELLVPGLKSGAVILADNVLFHGQVLAEPIKGKNAKAIHMFNEHVKADQRVETVLLTVRDGLLLIRKK